MHDRRLHVLVVPQQFPRHPRDVAGIFSLDYIAAIRPYCDVTVLLPGTERPAGVARERTQDGVEYVTWTSRLQGGSAQEKLGRLASLYKLGRLDALLPNIDLVHAHGPVFNGIPACSLARRLGVPVVLSVHTGPLAKLLDRAFVGWLTRRTLERVDCVCPVSDDLRRQITDAGITPRRVEVTYNPVDTDLFRLRSESRSPRQRIVFAGRLEEYKGALRVVQAFAHIADAWPGWTLTIAGEGPEHGAIAELIRSDSRLVERVQLVGLQTKAQLSELFTSSDCLVYPSRHETFGLVLAEAMSTGLPVVAPDRTAPVEFVDASCGVLVPPDDVVAIARAIDKVLTQLPSYRPDEIRNAIVHRFGFAAFGRNLLALYEDVCRTRPTDVRVACAA